MAGRWLDALTAAARGGCVLALPFADADLVALNRGGLGELAVTAQTRRPAAADRSCWAPRSLGQVVWPADGVTDEAHPGPARGRRQRAVLLSADGIEQGRTQLRAGVVPLGPTRPSPSSRCSPIRCWAWPRPDPGSRA